jgi:hypothetical protein
VNDRSLTVPAPQAAQAETPTLQAKLAEVIACVHELRDVEQSRLTTRLEGWEIVYKRLSAARAIYKTAETFAQGRPGTDCDAWLGRLTGLERELWRQMRDAGDQQLHGECAELIAVKVAIPWEPAAETFHGAPAPAPARPASYKLVPRFRRYPSRPASDVCAEYLALCQRFVNDVRRLS